MRAARSSSGIGLVPKHRKNAVHPPLCRSTLRRTHAQTPGFISLYAGAFLFGYFPGILLGRSDLITADIPLASYYMDVSHYRLWTEMFVNQFASAFLQLLFVVLCGFSVFGAGFLALLFLSKGIFIGFCAAGVLAQGGVKALFLYWSCSCLSSLSLVLLMLWLSLYAVQVSRGLFQSIFSGGAPRGQLAASARRMSVRFLLSLFLSGIFSIIFSGLSVLILHVIT